LKNLDVVHDIEFFDALLHEVTNPLVVLLICAYVGAADAAIRFCTARDARDAAAGGKVNAVKFFWHYGASVLTDPTARIKSANNFGLLFGLKLARWLTCKTCTSSVSPEMFLNGTVT